MTNNQFGDVKSIRTFDGQELVFTGDVLLLAYGNLGAPPTNFITRKGYKQNGVTEVDYLLEPRTISVELWSAKPSDDRQDYWDMRRELHDFLRPNRGGPLEFIIRTPNQTEYAITVRADPGLVLPPQTNDNDWDVREQFDFIAFDPIFRNETQAELDFQIAVQEQLIFPITFPISFGTSDLFLTSGDITYTGTWKTYPTITLLGPYSRAVITNVTTGVAIYMAIPILEGESRIIDLTPGEQSITDGNGNNKFSDLGIGSNLIDFALQPDPIVADGIQQITIQLVNGENGISGATLSYYERYFAL